MNPCYLSNSQPFPLIRSISICLDCAHQLNQSGNRCSQCGSPRILSHPELDKLAIAHIDCDAFYASIEKRNNPELVNKPVIIGGGKRSVVSTACYVARIRGVHSAMPMFKALEICPDAIVIRPNMEKYSSVSREIRQIMRELTPAIELTSIDEAFLDMNGTTRLHGAIPAKVLVNMANKVKNEIGVSVSIGLSYCRFLAKIASDMKKPQGFFVIGRKEAVSFLAGQPVSIIPGIGKVSQKMLFADGIRNIADIQVMEESHLVRRYGSLGLELSKLSQGKDARSVEPRNTIKSISCETTFDTNKITIKQLAPSLRLLCEKVAKQIKNKNLSSQTITLKMKTNDFKNRTKSHSLPDPTQLADKIYKTCHALMIRELDGSRLRLIGVSVSRLSQAKFADPPDLIDYKGQKWAKVEKAVDATRKKFGEKSLELGLTFDPDPSQNN